MLTKKDLKVAKIIRECKYVGLVEKETNLTFDELLYYLHKDYIVCLIVEEDQTKRMYFTLPHAILLALETFERESIRWLIPTVLSVIAIILSIVALTQATI